MSKPPPMPIGRFWPLRVVTIVALLLYFAVMIARHGFSGFSVYALCLIGVMALWEALLFFMRREYNREYYRQMGSQDSNGG